MTFADYLHPVVGGLFLALWWVGGSLGLRARRARPGVRAQLLRRHEYLARLASAGLAVAFASGMVAVLFGRQDLVVGSTTHFKVGSVLVLVAGLQWISSEQMHRPWVRSVHPWIGAFGMLLGVAHVFFGLQLTR